MNPELCSDSAANTTWVRVLVLPHNEERGSVPAAVSHICCFSPNKSYGSGSNSSTCLCPVPAGPLANRLAAAGGSVSPPYLVLHAGDVRSRLGAEVPRCQARQAEHRVPLSDRSAKPGAQLHHAPQTRHHKAGRGHNQIWAVRCAAR